MTKCLGIKNPRELTSTISSVMDYLIAHSDEDAYPDFEYTAPIRQHTEGVDFIPANASLAATEVTLVNSMSRETILRQYLDRVKDEYNYVLIDCRPSLGLTVVNALTAADSVIIPVQAHILAADDMDALFKTIGRVKRNLNPRLQVDGIVMTMVDSRTNLSRNTIRAVRDAYGSLVRVFKSEIPFAIRAAEVPEDEEKLRMLEELISEDYNELWAELLDVDIYGGLSYEELTQISANLPIGTKGGDIAQAALSKVGTAYSVMDCSQLTQYAYAQAGVSLPRTSVAQAKYCYDNGYAISSVQLQPGDLIF